MPKAEFIVTISLSNGQGTLDSPGLSRPVFRGAGKGRERETGDEGLKDLARLHGCLLHQTLGFNLTW